MKGWKGTEGLKAGQGTLEGSVTMGDQHATFQQAPNLRALDQTHFLSHTQSAKETHTLMASSLCNDRMFSMLPMPFPVECTLSMDCGSYRRPEKAVFKFIENIRISKL